jgi:hypothetical protein
MFDYFRIELPGFFAIALAFCAVTPVCLFWYPVARFGWVYLYAPYLAFLLWLVVVVMCVRVHRWRGFWVLTTAMLILPMTYLHFGLIVMCKLSGNCL